MLPYSVQRLSVIIVLVSFLASCAGREARPITSIQLDDGQKSCDNLLKEMKQNEEKINKLENEKSDIVRTNVIKGILGVIFIVPLFFLDLKGAPRVEINAYEKRNERINEIYTQKCPANQHVVSSPTGSI